MARNAKLTPEERSAIGRRMRPAQLGLPAPRPELVAEARQVFAGLVDKAGRLDLSILATREPIAAKRFAGERVGPQVLAVLRAHDGPMTSNQIGDSLIPARTGKTVQNVLSGLQTRKRVVSEPMPGSRRERLWRLA
jgi:hypothetical protein